jgi:lysophospholipid acyltransferase (LPLAT)-like uncharacterized protein
MPAEPAPPPFGPLRRAAAALLAALGAALLRLLGATWRVDRAGLARLDALAATGKPVVVAFWHEKYLPLFILTEGRRGLVLTSRSFRGEVIAAICRRFGHCAQFAATGEADATLALLANRLAAGPGLVGLAVDGPLGPRRRARDGAPRLAARLGAPLLPIGFDARPSLRLRRRWDRMELPLPFARITLRTGEPLPPPEEEATLAACQQALGAALNALDGAEPAPCPA